MQELIPGSWKQFIHLGTQNPWDLGCFSTAKLQLEYQNGFLGCMNRQEDEGRDCSLVLQQMWNALSSSGTCVKRTEKIQVLFYTSAGSRIPHPHLWLQTLCGEKTGGSIKELKGFSSSPIAPRACSS